MSPSLIRTKASGSTVGHSQIRQRNLIVEESQPPQSTFLPRDSVVLSKTGVRRLTDVEIQRHEKGLCYRCDEKFSKTSLQMKGTQCNGGLRRK